MSVFKKIQSRQIQRRANSFIESLKKKSEKEIEQAYLDSKEFENNEIVLSYLFFNHTSLIRILPVSFQKSRINSNLKMFEYGSQEAKNELISEWLSTNKFFMNALAIGFTDEEWDNYIKLYFNQPNDICLLYMEDLKRVISTLSKYDQKQTENLIKSIKDKLNSRQWEYIIEVNPAFIQYANQEVQDKHATEEQYLTYLSGKAREKYVDTQVDKIDENYELLKDMDIDVQTAYCKDHPYIMNYLPDDVLVNVLKYDISLIKYVNLSMLKNKKDKTQEVVCGILDNIQTKTNKEVVNILVNKCLLNAKGKLYRFDPKSDDISYQYTKRIIKRIQRLSINHIITLIMIDANYILPYVAPLYNEDATKEEKEKIIIDCNSRCLHVFKEYFGKEIYDKYYKVINKIFNEYLINYEKYDFSKDYKCVLELLKILFNKDIIEKNNYEKISIYIGTSLMYKDKETDTSKRLCVKLLNEILSTAYESKIDNRREIYNINSLELFDKRLSFISSELLYDYSKYNFVNVSNLLLIIKSEKIYDLFKMYYEIVTYIYGENKESLYRAIENFNYYKNILLEVKDQELTNEELDNLSILLTTFFNPYKIEKRSELDDYDITILKKIVKQLGTIKDENMFKNILCNYLYNKSYDEKGNSGWLETDTIKGICSIFETESLKSLNEGDRAVFTTDEINLFAMTKLLFSVNDFDLLLSFIENVINNKVKRNILSVSEFFNKIKKYKVELINNEVVTLADIESLYQSRPDMVMKNKKDGVDVYTVVGQDFKVLGSTSDDGVNYECVNAATLKKNLYAYDSIIKGRSIRFNLDGDNITIKMNKDSVEVNTMKPSYIMVASKLTDELISIAKENDLKIVEVQGAE